MAFSATEWRNLLADYSGSSQGDRSWSGLGKSTRQGEYYNYFTITSYSPTKIFQYVFVGFGSNATPAKNYQAYYAVVYVIDYYFVYTQFGLTAFSFGMSNQYTVNYYAPSYTYQQFAFSLNADFASSNFFTNFSFYAYTSVGGYTAPSSWSPSTFTNFAPWGNGPYSAGSNIAIGRGPGGSPSSGYPYQYLHN